MKNGDTGFIGAKSGETVLTQDFTKILRPATAIMQEFTDVMQNAGSPNIKEVPARQEVTIDVYKRQGIVYLFLHRKINSEYF